MMWWLDVKSFLIGLFMGIGIAASVYFLMYANTQSAQDEVKLTIRGLIEKSKYKRRRKK